MTRIFVPALKIALLITATAVLWQKQVEPAGILVLFVIMGSYLWKWESKILLFSGLFLLFSQTIFRAIGREDLMVPHMQAYGIVLMGVWCIEIIDYAVKHWPEYLKIFVIWIIKWLKRFFFFVQNRIMKEAEVLPRQAFSMVAKQQKNVSVKVRLGLRQCFLLFMAALSFFWNRIVVYFQAFWKVMFFFFQKVSRGIFYFILKHKIILSKIIFLVSVGTLLNYFFHLDIPNTLVWLFFLCGILFRWKFIIAISFAMVLIFLSPIFLALQKPILANLFSIYAYYFLIIGIVMECIDMKRRQMQKIF